MAGGITDGFKIRVDADTSKLTGALEQASKKYSRFSDDGEKNSKRFQNAVDGIGKGIDKVNGLLSKPAKMIGLTIGFGALIHEAFQLNRTWNDMRLNLKGMSDASGSTSKALNTQLAIWGKTGASLSTVASAMESMNAQGLPVATEGFKDMTAMVANLNLASGISMETLSEMTAGMKNVWQVGFASSQKAIDAMLSLQKSFGLTNKEIELTMKTTTGVFNKMASLFKDTDASMKVMSKGIGAATGVMKKFGVSVQQSGDWLQKMMDPENLEQNMVMFSRLGISYEETMSMMTDPGGQATFLDKMMKNLPALSQQIMNLANPMAKMNFAKSIGLPLEIASKMAKATSGEIEQLMTQYKNSVDASSAAEEKQKQMAAENARYEDAMMMLRTKALTPLMEFVTRNMPKWMGLLDKIAGVFAKAMTIFAKVLDAIVKRFEPLINKLLDGDFKGFFAGLAPAFEGIFNDLWPGLEKALNSFIVNTLPGLINSATKAFVAIIPVLINAIGTMAKGLSAQIIPLAKAAGQVIVGLLQSGPIGALILALGAFKAVNFAKNIKDAFMGKPGENKGRPLFVRDVDKSDAGQKGVVGGVIDKVKTVGTGIMGAAKEVLFGEKTKQAKNAKGQYTKGKVKRGAWERANEGFKGAGEKAAGPKKEAGTKECIGVDICEKSLKRLAEIINNAISGGGGGEGGIFGELQDFLDAPESKGKGKGKGKKKGRRKKKRAKGQSKSSWKNE